MYVLDVPASPALTSTLLDLDRSNLGNARLMGLTNILGKNKDPTGVLFDWVNSAFFFSYVSRSDCILPDPSLSCESF